MLKFLFMKPSIQKILHQPLRMKECTNNVEWDAIKKFRQKYFFDPNNIDDPYKWTFNNLLHKHFVFYQNNEIIGYTHLQLWPENRAAMRIIVIDETKRNQNLGTHFLHLSEKWLKNQSYKSLHIESSPAAIRFYRKNGYIDMPFNDPDGYEGSPEDIPVGKILK